MNITDITKLIALVLAISIAGERLVTFLKTIIPPLADPSPNDPVQESTTKKIVLMLLSFLACWITACFLHGKFLVDPIDIGGSIGKVSVYLLGLMAMGGSAFWRGILGYTKAVQQIKVQQFRHEKVKADLALNTQLSAAWHTAALTELRREKRKSFAKKS